MNTKSVLVVYHSQSGNTEAAAKLLADGVKKLGLNVLLKPALTSTVDDLLNCDGIVSGKH